MRCRVEEQEPLVFAFPLDHARALAERILLAEVHWKCLPLSKEPDPDIEALAPSLRYLFSRWETIRTPGYDRELFYAGPEWPWWEATKPQLGVPETIGISSTVGYPGSLWVLAGDERIHERLGGYAPGPLANDKVYPSIWHWIIMQEIEAEVVQALLRR